MHDTAPRDDRRSVIAIMGATGTGKSTFIKQITGNDNIVIGHDPESQTFSVERYFYIDPYSNIPVMLVDTPGFDDSREGVTDTDILGRITAFLQEGGGWKLNAIIYMHRISDPRMGGMAKKNLRMFRELCGDKNLGNVCIVTTNWARVGSQEGINREAALADGAFKPLLDGGAIMIRQDRDGESALSIISQLIHKEPVSLKIQDELNAGTALGDTSAGRIIVEEMRRLKEKQAKELEELRQELETAEQARDEGLKAELAEERRKIEQNMARALEDEKTLSMAPPALVSRLEVHVPPEQPRQRPQSTAEIAFWLVRNFTGAVRDVANTIDAMADGLEYHSRMGGAELRNTLEAIRSAARSRSASPSAGARSLPGQ